MYEIWVTDAELRRIRFDLEELIDTSEDRLHLFALDPRTKPRLFGVAETFADPYFVII